MELAETKWLVPYWPLVVLSVAGPICWWTDRRRRPRWP